MSKMPAFLKAKAPKVAGGMTVAGGKPMNGAAAPKGLAPPFMSKGAKSAKMLKMKKK